MSSSREPSKPRQRPAKAAWHGQIWGRVIIGLFVLIGGLAALLRSEGEAATGDLVRAFTAYAWPLVALTVLVRYQSHLAPAIATAIVLLVKRLRKYKEFEWGDAPSAQESAESSAATRAGRVAAPDARRSESASAALEEEWQRVQEILERWSQHGPKPRRPRPS